MARKDYDPSVRMDLLDALSFGMCFVSEMYVGSKGYVAPVKQEKMNPEDYVLVTDDNDPPIDVKECDIHVY